MKILFYALFAFAGFATLAWYGATDKKQKRTYLIIAVVTYTIILILANRLF